MPCKDPAGSTNHQSGMARMLDVQFRHLRYDVFEPVIDACYHASQQLAVSLGQPTPLDYEAQQRTARGTQYFLFRDVELEDLRFEREGIHLRLSFACPARLRQRHLLSSGHLESGMLMAVIGLDANMTVSTTFCKIEIRQSTLAMKPITGNHFRAAVVASFADPTDTDAVRQALQGLRSSREKDKFAIVEFPSVLVAGYDWILKHLQQLSSNSTEVAFSDLIAPTSSQHSQEIPKPAYTGRGFDLSILQATNEDDSCPTPTVGPGFLQSAASERNNVIENICSTTTLDRGQATALCENLSRGLAFTQGPPGTGKTYLGVSLAKVILRHVPNKPILVACMTNHALDNFLGDLVKEGITKVARLGNGSKEDWIGKHTLASLAKNFKLTYGESLRIGKSYRGTESLLKDGTKWCEALNSQTLTWDAVRDHLERNYWKAFNDLSKCLSRKEAEIEDIHRKRSTAGAFAFQHWSTGGDLKDIEAFKREIRSWFGKTKLDDSGESEDFPQSSPLTPSVHRLANPIDYSSGVPWDDVWSLPMAGRIALLAKWESELGASNTLDKLVEIQQRYHAARETKSDAHNEVDARLLAGQDVIGMTTTACAKHWSMLKTLDLQTLICEEAGEIMEAQTITTLLPSITHAIFIGDPLQLRPQVDQPCLSLETTQGSKYRLDESLFERMAMPRAPGAQSLPVSKLNLQRRMHPDVADLMRATLYPFLQDHPSTTRLPVAGMAHRTFWLDHQEPEDIPDPLAVGGRSYSNSFECAMISELVRYLLNTNDFDSGDISVLVPYSRQLACLKERLSRTVNCSIALSDEDKEDLADMGLLDDAGQQPFRMDVEVRTMVRLATIDGFQGEEAKVIILSTVRSNLQDRVGFLQTTNRINVACSRARNGFYIVGNSTLLRTVDMWGSIIADFHSKERIELDSEFALDRIFEMSSFGEISDTTCSMAEACKKALQCPQCGASCGGVQRYRHIRQFQLAPVTIERLYKMFGRKMDMGASSIRKDIENLDSGFQWFCKSIDMGPVASQQSAALIKARMTYLMSTQTAITQFRDQVVRKAEKDVEQTIGRLGDTYTSKTPSLSFKCRFDVLYLHCRWIQLREATRIIQFVEKAYDSKLMDAVIGTLRLRTIAEAKESIQEAGMLVAECRSKTIKRVEAEALIIRVGFARLIETLDTAEPSQQKDVSKWLEQANNLAAEYPDTAGLLKSSLESVKKYWHGEKNMAELWTPEARVFWEKWGRFRTGSLVYCEHGHPYTTALYRGCPECGRFVDPTVPAAQPDYESRLNRDKFLEVLQRMTGTH
ncbi:MAG: hypothetical protein LQ346_003535 [Caloplaca aetnensis]|nr:MAG: hypothetical protein LQ346_003535 [Caloplaca aetnensis]